MLRNGGDGSNRLSGEYSTCLISAYRTNGVTVRQMSGNRVNQASECQRAPSSLQCDDLPSLFFHVVLHRGDDTDGLHEAGVGAENLAAIFAGLAGVTALISGQNRENALISLPNGPDLAA